jgi:CBS domain-containing protein
MTNPASSHSVQELFNSLTELRDRTQLQAHLLSLDARKRWERIEPTLLSAQAKLERSGEELTEGALTKLRDAMHAAGDLLLELDRSMEMATPVRNVMKAHPKTCTPADSLNRAVQLLWEQDCGAVPVVDAGGVVVGMITDRDITMAAYTRGQQLTSMSVGSTMSTAVQWCSPEHSLGDALRQMAEKQVRRLPVVEGGKLVGLLTLADISRHVRHQGAHAPAWVALGHAIAEISRARPHAVREAAE